MNLPEETLAAFSNGLLSRDDAVQKMGLRDYAGLLIALGDANLPMPMPSPDETQKQVEIFRTIWKMG